MSTVSTSAMTMTKSFFHNSSSFISLKPGDTESLNCHSCCHTVHVHGGSTRAISG
jgi:hypothetical protein